MGGGKSYEENEKGATHVYQQRQQRRCICERDVVLCVNDVSSLRLAIVETIKGKTATIKWLKKREKMNKKIQVGKKVIVSYGKTYHIAVVLSKEKDDGITDRWKVKYEDGGVEHVKAGEELSCFEDKTKK